MKNKKITEINNNDNKNTNDINNINDININNINDINNINFNKLIDENNKINDKIFELVKKQEWKELINFLRKKTIDLNIKDNSNTYLLEYAIIFNQSELIDVLLEKNVRIDIIDDSSKSILYNVIKFSYTDILIKLLEKNKSNIGRSILEIKDYEENIPLFYAIKFYNIECLKIILSYTKNFYIKNLDGENALHLAIKIQNFDIFKLVQNYIVDFKARNKQGESYLHLIIKYKCYDTLEYLIHKYKNDFNFIESINFVEYKYNFTILHYICIQLDLKSLQIIYNNDLINYINGDTQDNSGNLFYHYFINNILEYKKLSFDTINSIIEMNEILKKIKFNINLYNIDGNTPTHLFFSNISFFSSNKLNILINYIAENADMNIQNFEGESVLFIIIKNNYWEEIYNILIEKKLDIFIQNNNSEIIFDFIDKKNYNKFLDMIVYSYLNQLKDEKKSSKWIEYWDIRCKKIIKYEELNDTEIDLIRSLEIKNLEKNNNVCFDIIKNKLDKLINIFIQTKNIMGSHSYPISHKFAKLINNYPSVIISTFSGSTIDVLSGLIYLHQKFNTKDNKYEQYLSSSIDLIKNKDNLIVCSTKKSIFGDENNDFKKSNICEIKGFEILWINKNIFFPTYKNLSIKTLIDSIIKINLENKSNGYRWIVVPIGIELNSFSHANYLIIDIQTMEIERFEPHGSSPPIQLNYEPEILDNIIFNYFNETGFGFKYFKPSDYLPKIGFQIKEINELKSDYIGDPNGFCALWCIWWCDIRLTHPDIPRHKLVKQLFKELINGKYSFKKLIRDYSSYIISIRDQIFIKSNTNINEWINDTISEKNIFLLNKTIKDEINNL
jgi:ankyrin repeat protein